MSRESKICGKRERRIPGFLADFLLDEKLWKNTCPKASSSIPTSTKSSHRKLQTSALSRITGDSGLSTSSLSRLNGVNNGSEEAVDVEALEPRYIRDCAADCQCYCCRPVQDSETESDYEMEFLYTENGIQAQVVLPTLSHRDMCHGPYEDPDYQRLPITSDRPRQDSETESDYEMEFYHSDNEMQAEVALPTLSHRDMCRPPYEDPGYQKQLVASYRRGLLSTLKNEKARHISNPRYKAESSAGRRVHSGTKCCKAFGTHQRSLWCDQCRWKKRHRLSPAESSASRPRRRAQPLSKKCRKVYGRDQRELWCSQCRWKKGCTRFGDD